MAERDEAGTYRKAEKRVEYPISLIILTVIVAAVATTVGILRKATKRVWA